MYSESIEKALRTAGVSLGDEVRVSRKGGDSHEGVLMPNSDSNGEGILIIKLRNGYNIGMRFDSSIAIEKLSGKRETFTFPKVKIDENRKLPKVTLIATGGTIGSKVDYTTGGVYALSKPEELLYLIPELGETADITINNLMSVWSEDMTFHDWEKLAIATAKALNGGAHGVVIMQGTDTMHYTSAALSFMLQGLNAPVVITGAQRSSDRGSSDAFMNMICSARVAAQSNVAEVGICMHAGPSDNFCSFTRGTKVRKLHTSRRDAFRPVNSRPMARVSVEGETIEYVGDYRRAAPRAGKVTAVTGFEPKVALVKFHPHSDPDILAYYLEKGYKGIIIEGTGLGHVAVNSGEGKLPWLDAIRKAVESGMVVGMTSQCLNGRVHCNVYTTGRLLAEAGVIYCEDMMPEVALVKLGFLLGNYGKEKAAELLNKNMVGEITDRTEVDW